MVDFHLPKWSARNPLGIVALFISLIYGMSVALLGASIKELSSTNQTILVGFIVVFPFAVLAVFAWLVARHHMKLYGPSDYRSDKSFLDVFATLGPAELAKRLERASQDIESDAEKADSVVSAAAKSAGQEVASSFGSGRTQKLAELFLVENLTFQILQKEIGAPIKRNVRLGHVELDGVVEGAGDQPTIIEVKLVGKRQTNLADVTYMARRRVSAIRHAIDEQRFALSPKFLIALVVEGGEQRVRAIESSVVRSAEKSFDPDVTIRVFSLSAMLKDYGISLV